MSDRIASLPQYDLVEIRHATDAWWTGIARHLERHGVEDVPSGLTRTEDDEAIWRRPGLILTQTCGYPLMTELLDSLRPVASPIYACEGCAGADYSSALIVRSDDPANSLDDMRGRRVAINNRNSHSGMNALRHAVAPLARDGRFFGDAILSGGHALSVAAVREARADIAAIDSVTLALLRRHAPAKAAGIRVLAWTAAAPSLPYATHVGLPAAQDERIRAALSDASADPNLAPARDALLLTGFDTATVETYRTMIDFRDAAEAQGYPEIA